MDTSDVSDRWENHPAPKNRGGLNIECKAFFLADEAEEENSPTGPASFLDWGVLGLIMPAGLPAARRAGQAAALSQSRKCERKRQKEAAQSWLYGQLCRACSILTKE